MKKSGKIIYIAVIVLLVGVFLFSAGSLLVYFLQGRQAQGRYDELSSLVDQARPTLNEDDPDATDPTATEPPIEYVTVTDPRTGEAVEVLPEFAELYVLNPEVVGWIYIDDTNVNYPVVQSAESNADYYLYRDFYGNDSSRGCIYIKESCDVFEPSDNLTIYGHRMKDGTMFGNIVKYQQKDFWNTHRYIHFDTLKERHTYEIVSVFITTATVGEGFKYHLFENANDYEEFEAFIDQCKALDLYDTGVEAHYGDKLITLSTCEYTLENGRLVVVAKRIK